MNEMQLKAFYGVGQWDSDETRGNLRHVTVTLLPVRTSDNPFGVGPKLVVGAVIALNGLILSHAERTV